MIVIVKYRRWWWGAAAARVRHFTLPLHNHPLHIQNLSVCLVWCLNDDWWLACTWTSFVGVHGRGLLLCQSHADSDDDVWIRIENGLYVAHKPDTNTTTKNGTTSNRGMNDWMEWNSCDKVQQVTLNRNHSPSLRHVTIPPFLHPSLSSPNGMMNPPASSWRANHHGAQPTYAIRHCCVAERELSLKFIKAPTEQENATHTVKDRHRLGTHWIWHSHPVFIV